MRAVSLKKKQVLFYGNGNVFFAFLFFLYYEFLFVWYVITLIFIVRCLKVFKSLQKGKKYSIGVYE